MSMLLRRYHEKPKAQEGKAVPEVPEGEPTEKWTNAQINAYAATHGIDLDGATKKADKLAAIEAAGEEANQEPQGTEEHTGDGTSDGEPEGSEQDGDGNTPAES